ncbi:hypothetical protein NX722_05160 [Endozoicomonas gorgoniicola]|uniref:Uncharacterized protein n=1 Tax=Endozoicomonas gorgoniicola TaxID=1234144 RepID=A0ABT3MRQ4_9GAMM|nr:hypothetical protein [Endozoicomonas gorgoniicola]MCW7552040.1 hypothetical protein [Endozoicomonas gorgoniicola]
MKPISKLLLLLELMICYGPSLCYLIIGIAFVPFWILSALSGEFQAITMVMMVVGGVVGFFALLALVYKICHPKSNMICDGKIRLLSLMGMISSIAILYQADAIEKLFEVGAFLYLLPIAASLHIIYLGRNYYFASCQRSERSD